MSIKLKDFSTNLSKLLKQFQYGEFDINNLIGPKNSQGVSDDYEDSTDVSDLDR